MKVTEATIQAVLMHWAMNDKHHPYVLPNSNAFFHYLWECDLISVTQAGLCHEYEIKLNRSDYKRDAEKRKHHWLGDHANAPAYFWYVTYGFEIEPPEKAGWISICYEDFKWKLDIKKNAPRLNAWRLNEQKQMEIARLLSWRITNFYKRFMVAKNGAGEPADPFDIAVRKLLDNIYEFGQPTDSILIERVEELLIQRQRGSASKPSDVGN